jgi:hypothetical protein
VARFREQDPDWPYLVYEFSYNEKVFYVGVAPEHTTRHTGRWGYVRNLVRHADAGTLTEGKARDFNQKCNQVLTKLIRAGLPQYALFIAWRGQGKKAAKIAELSIIRRRIAEGYLLANMQGNANKRVTVDEIIQHMGVALA